MSRTYRKILKRKENKNPHSKYNTGDGYEIIEGGDAMNRYHNNRGNGGKKMKPYTNQRYVIKYDVRTSMYPNGGHDRKEAIANANRSHKKAYRQQLKKELKKELHEILEQI